LIKENVDMEFDHKLINFECNICSEQNQLGAHEFTREGGFCTNCNSNVRLRSIIHLLSISIFGESLSLPNFPIRRDLLGIGMSDWEVYATVLKEKFSYSNTYYHKDPKLDITKVPLEKSSLYDFIISSDVFEHIAPPVEKAFINTFNLIKNNGVFIFSVPFSLEEKTLEHFPNLHDYSLELLDNKFLLKNTTIDGKQEVFESLIFHGGPGSTLEMRLFSKEDLIKQLKLAGFKKILILNETIMKYGIFWQNLFSLPIVASK